MKRWELKFKKVNLSNFKQVSGAQHRQSETSKVSQVKLFKKNKRFTIYRNISDVLRNNFLILKTTCSLLALKYSCKIILKMVLSRYKYKWAFSSGVVWRLHWVPITTSSVTTSNQLWVNFSLRKERLWLENSNITSTTYGEHIFMN